LALLANFTGCVCPPAQLSADGYLKILKEPKSQTVPVGSTVTFSVLAKHVGPSTNALSYQWQFNGTIIAGATQSTYTKPNVQFTDAGQYAVLVTGSQLLSTPADLAVFSSTGNSGSLSVGVTSFQNGNNNQACFPSSQWDKYFVVPNCYLCGASVSQQCFANTTRANTCTISTCDPANANGTLQTGIVIQYEFNPNDKVCSTNSCTGVTPATSLTVCSRTMAPSSRYRATIFYKSSTIGNLQNIIVDWSYQ
jgi:hypothetical protein